MSTLLRNKSDTTIFFHLTKQFFFIIYYCFSSEDQKMIGLQNEGWNSSH